jgi:hypothetical protein
MGILDDLAAQYAALTGQQPQADGLLRWRAPNGALFSGQSQKVLP